MNSKRIPVIIGNELDNQTGNKILASRTRCRSLRTFRRRTAPTLLSLALMVVIPAQAAPDLTQFSLESLMSMEITSASRKSQRLSEAATAIHVITRDDILHSGMTSIPELLRMVPGLHVANIDANQWAISSRGFNGRFSNKLLVLMDGRTLYTPLFSGVYWDAQNTVIEDIERIEVIRGPGGTLWGTNAVNGVINIITRHARDTQGGLVVARAGEYEKGATLRYGSALGGNGWFRAYAKVDDNDNHQDGDTAVAHDAAEHQQAGFRADWAPSTRDSLTLQGDIYNGSSEQTTSYLQDILSVIEFREDSADLRGGNLLLRWQRTLKGNSDWEFKGYFDRAERDEIIFNQRIDTFDLEFKHRFQLTEHQELNWGLGYRYIQGDIDDSFYVSFGAKGRKLDLYSGFIQDEIHLRDNLRLTLGSKFEYNEYTSFEYQPNARLLWQATQDHTLWGSVSRAVRTPSRAEWDARINFTTFPSPFDPDGPGPLGIGDPMLISIVGDKDVESETVVTYELGYRGQLNSNLNLDVTTFFSRYDNLVTREQSFSVEQTSAPPHALLSSATDNQLQGDSHGLELTATWQAMKNWRLRATSSWLKIDAHLDSSSNHLGMVSVLEDSSPEHQLQLHSQWSICHDMDLDLSFYFAEGTHDPGPSGTLNIPTDTRMDARNIPAYTRMDARFAWRPSKDVELSLVGQNLLDDRHIESASFGVLNTEVPRSVYGQIKVQF